MVFERTIGDLDALEFRFGVTHSNFFEISHSPFFAISGGHR